MSFYECPKGHKLPFAAEGMASCTPVKCGVDVAKAKNRAALRAERSQQKQVEVEVTKALAAGSVEGAKALDAADAQQAVALLKFEKWAAFLKLPNGELPPDAAEKYADAKLASLLPVAVAVLEDQLKYGTREEQRAMARQVLESNGRGKREAAGASTPPIIIQLQGGVTLPWRTEKTVEAVPSPSPSREPDTK